MIHRFAASLVGILALPALAEPADEPCPDDIAGFSELGRRIANEPELSEGDLLSIQLIGHSKDECQLAFRVDVLSWRGSVMRFVFDAETLEQLSDIDEEDWLELVDEPYEESELDEALSGEGGEEDDIDFEEDDDAFAEPGDDDFEGGRNGSGDEESDGDQNED